MPCLQEETVHTVGCILQHCVAELEAIKKVFHLSAINFKHHVKIRANILM